MHEKGLSLLIWEASYFKYMFIGENLIYLQMQKTACTHIAYLLSKIIKGEQVGKHNWLESYDIDKLIVGSIRNPWNWYVSLWAYGCQGTGSLFNRLTNRRLRTFLRRLRHLQIRGSFNEFVKPIETWKKCYQSYKDPACFRQWLRLIYNSKRSRDLEEKYYKYTMTNFAGFMTHRYCRLYLQNYYKKDMQNKIETIDDLRDYDNENNLLDFVIKTETLEKDLISALRKADYNLDEKQIDFICKASRDKKNKSKHQSSSYYYDKATNELVAKKEQFLIEKYGYKPP